MPFTPFHFGPGLAAKAVAPSYFSFTVFIFSQVLIDLEPLYYMLNGEWPLHRFFHTFTGATIIAIVSFVMAAPCADYSWLYPGAPLACRSPEL